MSPESETAESVPTRLRRVFEWLWPSMDTERGEDRAVVVQVLIAIVWLPIQITLSLVFATGGLFLLLILGILLSPFIALFFLIRHLARGSGTPT